MHATFTCPTHFHLSTRFHYLVLFPQEKETANVTGLGSSLQTHEASKLVSHHSQRSAYERSLITHHLRGGAHQVGQMDRGKKRETLGYPEHTHIPALTIIKANCATSTQKHGLARQVH